MCSLIRVDRLYSISLCDRVFVLPSAVILLEEVLPLTSRITSFVSCAFDVKERATQKLSVLHKGHRRDNLMMKIIVVQSYNP